MWVSPGREKVAPAALAARPRRNSPPPPCTTDVPHAHLSGIKVVAWERGGVSAPHSEAGGEGRQTWRNFCPPPPPGNAWRPAHHRNTSADAGAAGGFPASPRPRGAWGGPITAGRNRGNVRGRAAAVSPHNTPPLGYRATQGDAGQLCATGEGGSSSGDAELWAAEGSRHTGQCKKNRGEPAPRPLAPLQRFSWA